jgi:single-stranded-DNA-specific exonuclease
MAENITVRFQKAAEMLLSFPPSTRIRVVSHYDADGTSAAGVLCTMLYRGGYEFHATLMRNPFTKGFERLKQEQNQLIIFADMGSGQLPTIEEIGCKAIILDHHQYQTAQTSEQIIQINSNLFGVDGNYEVSGATLSFLLATTVDPRNEDLAPLALTGAIGDKQYIGEIRGMNKSILDAALQKGFLTEQTGLKLCGDTLGDALYYAVDPYYIWLSGKQEEIQRVLKNLHLEPSMNLSMLAPEALTRLSSFLLFRLLKAGCQPNIIDTAIRKRYSVPSQGYELERFADLLDACGKNGHRGLGLSLCLGDPTAWEEAVAVEKDYKQKLLDGLQALQRGGIHETPGMRYFYSENSSLGGVVAGIAMNYVLDDTKPLFALTRKEIDSEVHVSCRGSQKLVAQGLDLGSAMKQVAAELGGFGGGHKIAAGATIAVDKENEFLEAVDKILVQQMKGVA